jgi:hypothetical protein
MFIQNSSQLNELKQITSPDLNFDSFAPNDPRSLHIFTYLENITPCTNKFRAAIWHIIFFGRSDRFVCFMYTEKIHNNRLITFVQLPRRRNRFYGDSIKLTLISFRLL